MPDFNEPIYMDNHATTRVDPRVVAAMLPYFDEQYGNPHSVHAYGHDARDAVDAARNSIAAAIGADAKEIVFTSGATESNNLAIRGVAERDRRRGNHIVSVTTEHKAVLDPLARLTRRGYEVTLLPVEQHGSRRAGWLDPQQIANAVRDDTCLVSVMLANNEIGVIQPIAQVGAVCRERGVLLHCDATQAVGKIPVDVRVLGVDLMSFSAHKIYGPKGIGALYIRRHDPTVRLEPQILGGGQQEGRRSGTLNVPGIVGLAHALRLCLAEFAPLPPPLPLGEGRGEGESTLGNATSPCPLSGREGFKTATNETARLTELRERLATQLHSQLADLQLCGPALDTRSDDGTPLRLPGNLNVSFGNVDGEALLLAMGNLAVSSGAACTSTDTGPSHVLLALGLTPDAARSSLRFGLGRFNSALDVDVAAQRVVRAVERLRKLS